MHIELRKIVQELTRLHGKLDIQIDEKRGRLGFARTYKQPLDALERKGLITPDQFSAGRDMAQLYFYAFGKSSSVSSNYQMRVDGGRFTDSFNSAMFDYMQAYQAINGRREREICVQVCCYDLPAGEGKLRYLASGLDDLAVYFTKKRR